MSRRGQRSEAAAGRILQLIGEREGLNVSELAARTGIPRSTLDHKLKRAPHTLSVPDYEDLADALGVTFESLFAIGVPA